MTINNVIDLVLALSAAGIVGLVIKSFHTSSDPDGGMGD